MALLPSKELLNGTKEPETTTGEFRVAMGHMREYLSELLGEDSSNKEQARATLGTVSADDIRQLRHTSAIATGTGDAFSAVFDPPVLQLTNGTTLTVRAVARNETDAPSFKADETGTLPVVKGIGQTLEKGDISGAGHWLDLRYDEVLNKWILLNPASGVIGSGIPYTEASGTPDIIVARFSPPLVELKNGMKVSVRALGANTSAEPLFQLENFEAYPLVKNINQPLKPGDISGEGYWIDCQFDGMSKKWVLQNPARGIVSSGVPVGTIFYFAAETLPEGYLTADGSEVGRDNYPDLFKITGTRYGEGNGQTTFNLPDLINRFPQGSLLPGQKIEAGLPNITGKMTLSNSAGAYISSSNTTGAFGTTNSSSGYVPQTAKGAWPINDTTFNAQLSNPLYGLSDTVQPPALTLLPCIKAFDTVPLAETPINTVALSNETDTKASRTEIEPGLSKAWVNFDASSGDIVIKNAANVQDVVRVEKGVFDVIFNDSIEVDTLTVMATSSALLTSVNRESLTGAYYPPAKERIRVVTGSGFPPEAEDAADINVIILG